MAESKGSRSGAQAGATRKESAHNVEFAKGGKTHMFGTGDHTVTASQDQAGSQSPGVTEHDPKDGSGAKFASGGSTKMHSSSPSVPAQSGITSAR